MKKILINGKIYIEKGNFAQAILIEDGFIKKVGSNEEILNSDYDSLVDLNNNTVIPGLNDSHLHLSLVGEVMSSCSLSSARSIEDIIQIGKKFLENKSDSVYLSGRGWNQDLFSTGEKRMINRYDLDKISKDIPIVFERVCGHIIAVNTKALEIMNTNEDTYVDGGVIEIGDDGKANGIFKENAIYLAKGALPEKTDLELEKEILLAADYALSKGITSVQSCDVMNTDADRIFRVIHNIYDNEKTKLRFSHQFNFQDIELFKNYLETEFKNTNYDEKFLSKGVLKLFKDGSLGARTAHMLKDYNDEPGTKGVEALSDKQLDALCELAHQNNITVVTHAIGDGAVESVINAYEKTINGDDNKLRHGIVHCQITSYSQLERIAKLNIPVMYQPIFLDYDTKIVESRVGKDLANTSYAFNTLLKLGAPVSFGTDSPVENCNPFPCIYCAVTRKALDSTPKEGFVPHERMSVEDVVDAYTIASAYNEFKENFKGRLKEGFVADLVVLDKDIFLVEHDEIKDISVIKTMIDGEFVYEK